jgi:hypothetical protein
MEASWIEGRTRERTLHSKPETSNSSKCKSRKRNDNWSKIERRKWLGRPNESMNFTRSK